MPKICEILRPDIYMYIYYLKTYRECPQIILFILILYNIDYYFTISHFMFYLQMNINLNFRKNAFNYGFLIAQIPGGILSYVYPAHKLVLQAILTKYIIHNICDYLSINFSDNSLYRFLFCLVYLE